MPTERPDIITVLEKEKAYHLEQVKRINLALAALKGQTIATEESGPQRQALPWAAKIDKLFESTDDWLTLDDVRDRLAEMGLPEALEKDHRNTVYSTLHRKVTKTKTLEKDENGRYRVRKPKIKGNFNEEPEQETEKPKILKRLSTKKHIERIRMRESEGSAEKKGAPESEDDSDAP
jgi:hypothetical protein